MKRFLKICTILLSGLGASVEAETVYWNGGTTGTWETAASWSGAAVPGTSDSVYAGAGATISAASTSIQVTDLTVGYSSATYANQAGKGTLTANSAANFTVTGSLGVGMDASGALTVGTAGTSDSVSIGSGDSASFFNVGVCSTNGPETSRRTASVDFSAVENVTVNVGTISILEATTGNANNYLPNVSVTLGTNNTLTASTMKIGTTAGPNLISTSAAIVLGSGTNDLNIDTIIIGGLKAQGDGSSCAALSVALGAGDAKTGTVSLAGKADGTAANLYVGYNNGSTGNSSQGEMNLSNAASVEMTLNNLIVAFNTACTNAGNTTHGTLNLGENATVTAASLTMATQGGTSNVGKIIGSLTYGGALSVTGNVTLGNSATLSTSTFTMNSGSFNVGGSVTGSGIVTMNLAGTTTVAGSMNLGNTTTTTLNFNSGSAVISGSLSAQSLMVAAPGKTASLTVGTADGTSDTVTIGNNGTGTFNVAWWSGSSTVSSTGTAAVDFSNMETVTIDVESMNIVTVGSTTATPPSATVTLGKNNSIRTNTLTLASSLGANLSSSATSLLLGSGTNTIQTDTLLVGGGKAQGTGTVCASLTTALNGSGSKSASVTISGKSSDKAQLLIAYDKVDGSTANPSQGAVDFSNASSVNMTLSDVVIAYNTYVTSADKQTTGLLNLGSNATVTADSITMATAGASNIGKLNASLIFGGGSLTVANDITMGSSATLSTTSITLNGGTLSVGGSVLAAGISSWTQNAGTANITESFNVRDFKIGTSNKAASLTAGTTDGTADSVSIGNGTTAMYVGYSDSGNVSLDFKNAETVDLNVTDLTILTNGNSTSTPIVTVTLGKSNTITANKIQMGQSEGANLIGTSASLVFGTENTINTNLFQIGGAKAEGTDDLCMSASILSGGTLTLQGKAAGTLTNLIVGGNTAGATATTSNVSKGLLDLTGAASATLLLDDALIGYNSNTGAGAAGKYSCGEVVLGDETTLSANTLRLGITDAGTAAAKGVLTISGSSSVTVDSVTMGNRTDSETTINLAGGSFSASTLTGTGTTHFNFTGGSLDVTDFGLSLTQNGAATMLTPGGTGTIGTMNIDGMYDFINGRLLIEIGADSCDVLNVVEDLIFAEDATLVLDVLEDPTLDSYTLMTVGNEEKPDDILALWERVITSGKEVSLNWTGAAGNWALVMSLTDPVPVPEPAAWVLLVLGCAGLCTCQRCRKFVF